MILSSNPSTNEDGYSGVSFFTGTSKSGSPGYTLMRFDLSAIPGGALVTSATVTVTPTATRGVGTVNAHDVLGPWDPTTVTWNNFSAGFDPTPAGSFTSGVAPWSAGAVTSGLAPASFDLTALAQEWVDGVVANNGILLEQSLVEPSWSYTYYADTPAAAPALLVCYEPQTNNPCAGVTCTASDPCHAAGVCDPTTGACSNPAQPDGTACNDGNACTQTDTCQAGVCTGSNPVVCTASDPCHAAGVCDPSTGACSNPAQPDGTACNDGNACTQTDTCQAGVCKGSNPVTCTASDQCHTAGACDPSTGACSNPAQPDGTACNDGNACTQTDTCQSGVCTGSNPVTCTASDQCHAAGTCDPSTGACSNPAQPDGTACNDGNACTQTDTCQAGVCTGSNPVTCTASDQCHAAGACDPATGACSNPAQPNGTPCNDGNPCTQTDTCQNGACTGSNPVVCTAVDACHVAGACDPSTGQCSSPAAPDGQACALPNAAGTCSGGTCTLASCNAGYSDCDGNPANGCETQGTCNACPPGFADCGPVVTTLAGSGQYGYVDGPAATAEFADPGGVAVDAFGDVFVADTNNCLIREVLPDGAVTTYAGSLGGYGSGCGYVDGPAASAQFSSPFGVAVDAMGDVYVADTGNQVIRKIAPDGTVTTLAGSGQYGYVDGPAATAEFASPSGVAVDALGNVYVADTNNCAVREITPDGNVSTLAGLPTGCGSFADVAVHASARPAARGAAGFVGGGSPPFWYPLGVAVDPLENVYVADTGNQRICAVAPDGTVTTLAGSGQYGYQDGPGASAEFASPSGVAVDAQGNVLVADAGNCDTRKVAPDGTVTTYAGAGATLGCGFADGLAAVAQFSSPVGVAVDAQGDVFVGDTYNQRVREIQTGGCATPLDTVDNCGTCGNVCASSNGTASCVGGACALVCDPGFSDCDGNAANGCEAALGGDVHNCGSCGNDCTTAPNASAPNAFATCTAGVCGLGCVGGYADCDGNPSNGCETSTTSLQNCGSCGNACAIPADPTQVATCDGAACGTACAPGQADCSGFVSTFAGVLNSYGQTDGPGPTAMFGYPFGIAVDGAGVLYVADEGNSSIRKIAPDGTVSTLAGSLTGAAGFADGQGTSARFYRPDGVAVDGQGNVYVADTDNQRIRKIAPDGTVTTLAGSSYGYADGPGASALFAYPEGVAVDAQGNVYVADANNYRVRKILPDGTVTTLAGAPSGASPPWGDVDGQGSDARFGYMEGIAVDALGDVYVADSGNNSIRKILPDGTVSTIAGPMDSSWGDVDGQGAAARFNWPEGLVVDAQGDVFVADSGNNSIRKIALDGTVTTVAGTQFGAWGFANGPGPSARFNWPTGVVVDAQGDLFIVDQYNDLIREQQGATPGCSTPIVTVQNCGGCGVVCQAVNGTPSCVAEACQIACSPGWGDCNGNPNDGCELPLTADVNNCGACGYVCPTPANAFEVCSAGVCGFGGCNQGFADCNGTLADGCEVSLDDPNNCGACGNVCPSQHGTAACTSESCTMSACDPGWGDCDGAVSTVAGAGPAGFRDGPATSALFYYPQDVAVDAQGNVYVADTSNQRIRKITLGGTVTTLAGAGGYGFADGPGSSAYFASPTGVAVDAQGNVYVADQGNQRIRKIAPDGTVSTLAGSGSYGFADGAAATAQFASLAGVAVDAQGDVFVADQSNRRVRKIAPDGTVTTLAGANGELSQPMRLAVDAQGDVILADSNAVRKIMPDGTVQTLASGSDVYGVAVDAAGNVYFDTYAWWIGGSQIMAVSPDGTTRLVAGGGYGYQDGAGGTARFTYVYGLGIDAQGNLFAADIYNQRIRKIRGAAPGCETSTVADVNNCGGCGIVCATPPNGSAVCASGACTVSACDTGYADCDGNEQNGCEADVRLDAGNCGGCGNACGAPPNATAGCTGGICGVGACNPGFGDCDGDPTNGCEAPLDTAQNCGACGNACTNAHGTSACVNGACVATCDAGFGDCDPQGLVSTLAGNGGWAHVDGPGASAQFQYPGAAAVDGAGNLYVADDYGRYVRKVAPDGTVSTLAGNGGYGVVDGAGASAEFQGINGIAVGPQGDLYVTDGNYVRKVASDGTVTTLFGGVGGYTDGPVAGAAFGTLNGIVADAFGNLYLSDYGNAAVRKVTSGGNVITLAGGQWGYADGQGAGAQFAGPQGLAIDAHDNLYVADGYNRVVRRVTPGGVVTTLAGTPGASGYVDGPAASAQFSWPVAVAVDPAGDVFVADQYNEVIRKIGPTGVVTTAAGGPWSWTTFADGPALSALFYYPDAVAVDAHGDVLISDLYNSRVRKLSPPLPGCANDFQSDAVNCGSCGNACPTPPHASPACTNATCGMGACDPGWGDCDGDPSNGCETDLTTNPLDCGACGRSCDDGNACTADACVASACTHAPIVDGTACDDGNACTTADACSAGVCVGGPELACPPIDGCHVAGQCSAGSQETVLTGAQYSNIYGCAYGASNGPGFNLTCTGASCGAVCATNSGIDYKVTTTPGQVYAATFKIADYKHNCADTLQASFYVDGVKNRSWQGAGSDTWQNVTIVFTAGAAQTTLRITQDDDFCCGCYGGCDPSCSPQYAGGDLNLYVYDVRVSGGLCAVQTPKPEGATCVQDHGTGACASGVCLVSTCDPGFGDCNGDPTDGCEADLSSTAQDCGACGRACSNAHGTTACVAGKCSPTCAPGAADCDGNPDNGCEAQLGSIADCAACGDVCVTPNGVPTCNGGACAVLLCNPGFGDCDGVAQNGCETDLGSSAANCGACGSACPAPAHATPSCTGGACGLSGCAPGWGDCDHNPANGCETSLTTLTDCGLCGATCSVANGTGTCASGKCEVASCAPGYSNCDNDAANGCETAGSCGCDAQHADCDHNPANGCETAIDTPQNCGGCGVLCPTPPNGVAACVNGACTLGACMAGWANCDGNAANGCETQLGTTQNCGGCGGACPPPATCTGFVCQLSSCPAGYDDCDGNPANGCETSLDTIQNCGWCGNACSAAHGTPACVGGKCVVSTCDPGYADCDKNPSNGCETALGATGSCPCDALHGDCDHDPANGCETSLDTPQNCGACGASCSAPNGTPACDQGVCGIASCDAGFADCDCTVADGCEVDLRSDVNNCGGCGVVCTAPAGKTAACAAGQCVAQ
jgi:sugar lactone lactonase YvrE